MGGITSLFSKPKVPDPEPMPDPQAQADAARQQMLAAARKRQGRASTMLSGDTAYSRTQLGTL